VSRWLLALFELKMKQVLDHLTVLTSHGIATFQAETCNLTDISLNIAIYE